MPLFLNSVKMYKVKSNRTTENNVVFLVPNKCVYPTLSQRIAMAAKGVPLPDMAQPDGIAKPYLDLEDCRGFEAAQLYEAQNHALKHCEDIQEKLNSEQRTYHRFHKK